MRAGVPEVIRFVTSFKKTRDGGVFFVFRSNLLADRDFLKRFCNGKSPSRIVQSQHSGSDGNFETIIS